MGDRQSLTSSKLKLLILEKYRSELDKLRNSHYASIEAQYDVLINDKQWLINPKQTKKSKKKRKKQRALDYLMEGEDDGDLSQYFSEQNVLKFTYRRCLLIVLLIFWVCFYRIYWTASILERVELGIEIFTEQKL